MAQLVFVVLSCLHKIGSAANVLVLIQVNFNLSATSTVLGVGLHKLIKLNQRVIQRLGSNIQHQSELRLDEFANALEEPLV